jgi:FkbM family methyltransferase
MQPFQFQDQVKVPFYSSYGKTFNEWLGYQLKSLRLDPEQNIGIDVGAFKGEFLTDFIENKLIQKGILFEPNPENFKKLQITHSTVNYQLENKAVGSVHGYVDFGYGQDGSTGSVLEPLSFTPKAEIMIKKEVVTLDEYVAANNLINKIKILKVDTQGFDLNVLLGAKRLIAQSQPIIIVELIYAPLYNGQCSPVDIVVVMDKMNYTLAGTFDELISREGWLAWCDACFIPRSRISGYSPPFELQNPEKTMHKKDSLVDKIKKHF